MSSLSPHPPGHSSLRHMIETGLSNLAHRWLWPGRGRRLARRDGAAFLAHRRQQHFGSLDDQLLSDLGLQRSDIRGAEYGVLPGDQALHHEDDVVRRDDEIDAKSTPTSQA
ncbi:MAG: hypothetical protein ACR2RA_19025 [Geminicoccaceae bacterium]